MIRLNCNNCKAQLSIDDAFAGGVCRCQYCGTIQTVPKHLKAADSSGSVALRAAAAKPASRTPRADPGGSSGLDALANAVAGSGLSGSLVGRPTPAQKSRPGSVTSLHPTNLPAAAVPHPIPVAAPPYPPTAPRTGLPLALIVIAVVILLLLGILVGLLLKNHGAG